jgi:hypothetical protein
MPVSAPSSIRTRVIAFLICAVFTAALIVSQPARAASLAEDINAAQLSAPAPSGKGKKGRERPPSTAANIKAEVLLDRAGFSPGLIDGKTGTNDQKAITAFQNENGVKPSGRLDAQTWERLTATSSDPIVVEYEIQPGDVKGHSTRPSHRHWRRRRS